jgi:hypothetical protein
MITFGDIKNFIAPYAFGGVCPDDPRCLDAVNEAVERLLGKPDLVEKLAVRPMRITAWGNSFTTPRLVDRVLKVRINETVSNAYSVWYEFMTSGPGMARGDVSGYQDLIDRGEAATCYDIPTHKSGYHLLALSDSPDDQNLELLVRGLDETGREVFYNGRVGERIPLTGGFGDESVATFTTNKFSRIINVSKPRTAGHVFLMTWDPVTGERFHLADYHPDETTPSYRRYSLKGWNYDKNAVPTPFDIHALVKVRAVPVTRDEDLLLISNRSALKAMVQAIHLYDSNDPERGAAYEGIAERILLDETANYAFDPNAGLDFQAAGWSMGDIPSIL